MAWKPLQTPRINFSSSRNLRSCVAEEGGQLVGEDLAGPDVVAVAEAAGQHEDLVWCRSVRVLAEAVDVDAVGDGAGELEGVLGLLVAVGARGPQDQDFRGGHAENFVRENPDSRL